MFRLLAGVEPDSSSGSQQEPLSLREEFRWRRFGLDYNTPLDFLRSQWQSTPKSTPFLVYRWALGCFFGVGVVGYIREYFQKGTVFIYLTNWGFILCGIVSISGAILVTVYHFKQETWAPPNWLIKTYWAGYWINIAIAFLIASIYWSVIYPKDRVLTNPTRVSDVYNLWTHLVPPIALTIDHLLVAQPARLLHFVYPLGFSLFYVSFAFVYYLLGGTQIDGRAYLYSFLDFTKPKRIAMTVLRISVVIVSLSNLQYGVYRLRTFIARKLGKLQ
ncbi:protein rolling stone [Drosophila eugracilis]|uniref:protein rolling stone n=1 Tax=Drosophila eugracilis TaxID=29029 RepID=UPI0007E62B14|nr:protein rolling stone [Drosophila eugracilis]